MSEDEVRYSSLNDNVELIQPVLTSERTPGGPCLRNPACADSGVVFSQGISLASLMFIFFTCIYVLFLTGHISNIEKIVTKMYQRFNTTD